MPAIQQSDGSTEKQPESSALNQVSVEAGADNYEAEFKAGKRELMIIGSLALLNVILALDATVLPPILPTLARDLGGTALETFWAGSSYLLSSAVFVPFLGVVSDLFGRQLILLFSVTMFTAGTMVSCLATTFTQLLCGRAIMGVGGGGIFALSYIVTADIIPLRQRPKYQAMVLSAWSLGSVIGPLTGGVVAEHARWQWIFYINFPFCALGYLAVPVAFRGLKRQDQPPFLTALKLVDWTGSFLFIAGTSAFLLGLTWGGVQYDWDTAQTLVPILLGLAVVASSLVCEAYRTLPAPFLRLSVFRSRSACIVFALSAFAGFETFTHMYYLSFYMISVKRLSTTLTGVYIMAVSILVVPISVTTGVLMARIGAFRWAIQLGFALLVISNGLLLLANQHRSVVAHVFLILTISLGHGFVVLAISIATQAIATARDVAHAVSASLFMRQIGLCLGVAIGGTVFDNVLLRALESRGVNAADARELARNAEAFANGPLGALPDGDVKTLLLDSYVDGFHAVFYLLLALAAVSLLLSLFIKHHDMNRRLESEHRLER